MAATLLQKATQVALFHVQSYIQHGMSLFMLWLLCFVFFWKWVTAPFPTAFLASGHDNVVLCMLSA